jgi:glycosidase
MPIYQTGSERSVGSPYAIKDYYRVHKDYGSLADLRALVDKAHALGMAVILDWVANHTAWDHEWMQTKSWYVQDDNGQVIHPPGTNWLDVAELNYGNADMRRAMIQAMKYWVLEANVDGYRCDFAAGVPFDFWRAAIDTLRSIPNRELIMFAEADQKALFGAGFDLIFGWPFYGSLRGVFRGQAASELYPVHLSTYAGLQQGQHIVRWVTNHDEHAWDATPQQIFGGEAATRAAFVLAATMGGVPLVYNGQEVAVPQQLPFFAGSHPGINWALNPATTAEYRYLLQLRSQYRALRSGQLADYSSADVALYLRTLGQEQLLVMVNVRNYAIDSYRLPDAIAHSRWTDTRDNSEQLLGESISLAPYEYLIFSR